MCIRDSRIADPVFLRELRALATENNLLLMFDEVQTGVGRTGRLWAHEWPNIVPDEMSSAKALGGGFPVGACLATNEAAVGIVPGTHGSTFGGNPLAAACANAVLDVVLEPSFLKRVVETGKLIEREITKIAADYPSIIHEIRGIGMMWGITVSYTHLTLPTKA